MDGEVKTLICRVIYHIGNKLIAFYNTGRRASGFSAEVGENSQIFCSAQIINRQPSRVPSAIRIGKNTSIYGILDALPYGDGIEIGDNCFIGPDTRLWSWSKITIGNDVLISHGCNIIDTNSHEIDYIKRAVSYRKNYSLNGFPSVWDDVKRAPITIKDYAWISCNVCILKGVTIGKGAIIGAGAVVTHDIPDFCLAAGNPAKVIKYIGPDQRPVNNQ